MTASEIRALFSVASRPEVVSLAGGMPYTAALPMDSVAAMLGDLINERGPVALQYATAQGDPTLRELICGVMALEGIDASPDDVVITVGSQQGLDLLGRIFLDPGDIVIAEGPSYVGALAVFAAAEAQVIQVSMDSEGLIPEALTETLDRLARTGQPAKMLYTVPAFHNPAGVTMAPRRRLEILDIAARHNVIVVEDNPYGLLGFTPPPLTALRGYDAPGVIYLGTFSKTIAPGFRVGWVLAPPAVRDKLVLANEAGVLCPPTFSQMAVASYLQSQPWQDQIKAFVELYRERRDAMLNALRDLLPGTCTWGVPEGGFYVWLSLPDGLDAKAMLPRAIAERVAYVPGTAFYAGAGGSGHMRLSYCYPSVERIREGIRRLATVVEVELDLLETFGPAAIHGSRTPRIPGALRADSPGPELA
ncbi:MAG: PLP-dependent aminotransferase family protein [Mycobacteriales bacterium]